MTVPMLDLAREIAAELGTGWTAVELSSGDRATMIGPDGESLTVTDQRGLGAGPGQVTVWGDLTGELKEYDNGADRINVGISRGAAVIARDIARRLLPGHRATLADARVAHAKSEKAAAAQTATRDALIAALPTLYQAWDANRRTRTMPNELTMPVTHSDVRGYGHLRLSHDGSTVTLNIHSMPAAVAIKVMETLAAGLTGDQS